MNFLTDDGQAKDAYEPETFRRLQALKAEYDPENVFPLNQNIPPA